MTAAQEAQWAAGTVARTAAHRALVEADAELAMHQANWPPSSDADPDDLIARRKFGDTRVADCTRGGVMVFELPQPWSTATLGEDE